MQQPFEAIRSLVTNAVRRSAKRELVLGVVLVVLIGSLLALFGAFFVSKPSVVSGIASGVCLLLTAASLAYVVSRSQRLRRPELAPFAQLLSAPASITSIHAQHITYASGGRALGQEHILTVGSTSDSAYCRLDDPSFQALMGYLARHAPDAMARWQQALAENRRLNEELALKQQLR